MPSLLSSIRSYYNATPEPAVHLDATFLSQINTSVEEKTLHDGLQQAEIVPDILEKIQYLLDHDEMLPGGPNDSGRELVYCFLVQLSEKFQVMPQSLFIKVQRPTIVRGGRDSDIYRGKYKRKTVSLRMVRSALLWPTQDPLRFKLLLACLKWRQLRHPNILPLFGADLSVKDTPTLVQPWIERGNIRDYIYHCNPKPGPSQLLSWLLDIAQGMKYLHEMGIHHGDLRGNNILLTDTNVPVIADIFMSTFRGEWTITFPRRKGTFERWLAPESIQAIEPSEKADIFSFGFVCIELFTGEIPFPALSDQDVVEKSRRGEIPEKPDNMPEEVWFLAKDCWCSDPAQRPPMIDVVNRLCGAERMNS